MATKQVDRTLERGFGSMDEARVRAIAHKGGEATAAKHGREFYREIGKKGGNSTKQKYGIGFYSKIGVKGGEAGGKDQKNPQKRLVGPVFFGLLKNQRESCEKACIPGKTASVPNSSSIRNN